MPVCPVLSTRGCSERRKTEVEACFDGFSLYILLSNRRKEAAPEPRRRRRGVLRRNAGDAEPRRRPRVRA